MQDADWHRAADTTIAIYTQAPFNYSNAINCAIPYLATDYTLIISSHTLLENSDCIGYAARLMDRNPIIAAASFSDFSLGKLDYSTTDIESFDGFNGCHNTACLYRTQLLRIRGFNPKVFASEDLEWSKWVLENNDSKIVHIQGCGRVNLNPKGGSGLKLIKSTVAIGYFVEPRIMRPSAVIARVLKGLLLFLRLSWRLSACQIIISIIFTLSPFMRFRFSSRY